MNRPLNSQSFTFQQGLVTDQPLAGTGIPGTAQYGLNLVLNQNGQWRTIRQPKFIEVSSPTIEEYTVNLTAGSPVVTGNAGAIMKTNFSHYQHVLIGDELFLVVKIISETEIQVSPLPAATLNNQPIVQVPNLHAVNQDRGSLYAGNVIRFRENVLVAVGRGLLRVNGDPGIVAPLVAENRARIAYPDTTGLLYSTHLIGFSKPGPPTLAAVAGSGKNMQMGNYSVRVARARENFPGYGTLSEAVEISITTGQAIEVTFPGVLSGEGQDSWIIFGSKRDNGIDGPWYELARSAAAALSLVVEWREEEITENGIAELIHTPPPRCLYCASIEEYLCFISTYGYPDGLGPTSPGPGVAVGRFNNPEAVLTRSFVTGGDDITGVKASSARLFFITPNTVQQGTLTGTQRKVLVIRPLVNAGGLHQYCACVAEEQVFLFKGDELARIIERSGDAKDNLDNVFSARVKSQFVAYKSERVFVEQDARNAMICVFHSNHQRGVGGKWQTEVMSYNLRSQTWNTPVLLGDGVTEDFTVTGVATISNRLHFSCADGKIYEWDADEDQYTEFFLATPFSNGGMMDAPKTVRVVSLRATANAQVSLHVNYDLDGLRSGEFGIVRPEVAQDGDLGVKHLVWKPSVKCESFALRVAGRVAGGQVVMEAAQVDFQTFGRRI